MDIHLPSNERGRKQVHQGVSRSMYGFVMCRNKPRLTLPAQRERTGQLSEWMAHPES